MLAYGSNAVSSKPGVRSVCGLNRAARTGGILGHSENDCLFPVEAVRAGDERTSDGVSANI